ncbi:hypothetical protein DRO61_03885 [Candidatus Bathyarchaeota archaeon]|nr:MAG: hypothetical protein DRO61_03885 [Candidatus Bathyarchaeota archaeon]
MYYLIGKSDDQAIIFSKSISRGGALVDGQEIINHFEGRGINISDVEVVSILPYKTIPWAYYDLSPALREIINIAGELMNVL